MPYQTIRFDSVGPVATITWIRISADIDLPTVRGSRSGRKGGRPGRAVINPGAPDERELRPLSEGNRLKKGDLVRILTSGGGGWGWRSGYYGPGAFGGGIGLIVVIIIVLLLMGRL